mmetsp:Transcript_14021/g.38104  ORF Transcript_14021/g.38104 Transcript_14021/m.38104 type:complete len:256 (+) Transcript_14021:71-838(+)
MSTLDLTQLRKTDFFADWRLCVDLTGFREPKVCDLTDVRAELQLQRSCDVAADPATTAPAQEDGKCFVVDLTKFMGPELPAAEVAEKAQVALPLRRSGTLRQCTRCQGPFAGASPLCSSCRKVGPQGTQLQCKRCGDFFQGHASSCSTCREAIRGGSPAQMVRLPDVGRRSETSTCASLADLHGASGSATPTVASGQCGSLAVGRQCSSCQSLYGGFGRTCSGCRKSGRSPRQCRRCQGYSVFFGEHCDDCAECP